MSDTSNDELWLTHCSCKSWVDPDRWLSYFEGVQEILGAPITHLDEEDPIRRRYDKHSPRDNAEFVTRFGEQVDSRMLFGRIAELDFWFSIWFFRDESRRANYISWHGPPTVFDDIRRVNQIGRLFDRGNVLLNAFYGYADTCGHQKHKKKEDGAVDLEEELVGVFWLTYFHERYVDFFGHDKFKSLRDVTVEIDRGATICLADTPFKVPETLRQDVENVLGPKSFVRHRDFTVKHRGVYALTYEQLGCQGAETMRDV